MATRLQGVKHDGTNEKSKCQLSRGGGRGGEIEANKGPVNREGYP